jgi:glycosyltransferase involved in cell wall biosynthesis
METNTAKKLKIMMFSAPYLPVPPLKYGGTERVIYNIVKGLSDSCDIKLVATGDSNVPCDILETTKEHLFFAKTVEDREENDRAVDATDAIVESHILKYSEWVDLYHSHFNRHTNLLRMLMDEKAIPVRPILTTLHGAYSVDQQEFYDQNGHTYFNSISNNQRMSYPKTINWAGTVYNSVDTADFPLNLNPDNYVCFLGRFDPEKFPHKAIELAGAWGVPIKLAGKIDHLGEAYFDEKIKPYIDGVNVIYLGELGVKEKSELLRYSLVNLHPTNFREPFGLTIVEAACSGTPTLAIRKGALPELIEHGRTGYCVEDFEEGYHCFDKLIKMKRKYISVRAKMLFDIDTMSEEYLMLYKSILQK